ncbi:MAG TPA: RagB/SusD family nutrient uptake outer membrane protein, partial [Chitinophagaceae bacterium]|nr:RagB/SusD family nutrient uptake outer membrane protein [Chitinophagaceae bacterium]
DDNIIQLSNHTVRADNPYASPKPFYELILSCNDALDNFKKMLAGKKFTEDEYNQRYSDIMTVRSWLYLQLGIHFGSVPYVVNPLAHIDDVRNASQFERITFPSLLDSLVNAMKSIPFKEEYTSTSTLRTPIDGFPTHKFFIDKSIVLGDIYLWRGKPGDYLEAARLFRKVMEYGEQYVTLSTPDDRFHYYKIWNAHLTIGYTGNRPDTALLNNDNNNEGWRQMFARPLIPWTAATTDQNTKAIHWEWIWLLPFDRKFTPSNPFIDLYSPVGGRYLLKPSQAAINNWNSQVQRNGLPGDARGLYSWRTISGQPVVMKHLYNYITTFGTLRGNVFDKDGKWFLYRAATLHLHFAEAANRDQKHRLAWALVNSGIGSAYNGTSGNKTNLMNTMFPGWDLAYQFDARNGDNPNFRAAWHRSVGVRGRAYVTELPVTGDSLTSVENMIINEGALETAFEGHRWPDLLRVAIRRNDPAFVADKIYNKLIRSGVNAGAAGQARSKLLNRDWYLPFKW